MNTIVSKLRVREVLLGKRKHYFLAPRRQVRVDQLGLLRFELGCRIHSAVHMVQALEERRGCESDALLILGGRQGIVQGLVEGILDTLGIEACGKVRRKRRK